jgi:hypothetical protein
VVHFSRMVSGKVRAKNDKKTKMATGHRQMMEPFFVEQRLMISRDYVFISGSLVFSRRNHRGTNKVERNS